ncbi:TonB-dependent receptor [Pseudotenacibaculum haliotis]|uniref:TonB-dependent receptor domain-containing protein n=1 Tax=Pseudotenacibaculum haliotis TaxID=1862138 RepID=A0ABW5LSM5_9FLAO
MAMIKTKIDMNSPSKQIRIILVMMFLISSISYAQVKVTIKGKVQDEKGAPILGATVFLNNNQGNVTDENGVYRITNVTPGSYNITASFLGYTSQTKFNIIVKSKGNPSFDFVLKESNEELEEVVLSNQNKISRPRETPLSTQSLSAVEIATYPGGNNDVVRVAQTFPGVSPSVGGFRNDLIIRGGAPNETVYYLDGMEIPNINHFATQGSAGGPVGLLNVSFINDVTLSTSAFGAQYDNPLSGVLQFKQRDGNREHLATNIRVSATDAAFTLEGPLFKREQKESKTSFLLSVRRSYLQALFELIGLPIRPNYWDYQYKLSHEIDGYNNLYVLGLGSIDDFTVEAPNEFDEEAQLILDQAPFIDQKTNSIGISWNRRFKDGSGFMQTTLSNNRLKNIFTTYQDSQNETGVIFRNDAVEYETKLRYQLTKFVNDWKLTGGFNTQYSYYKNNTINNTDNIFFTTEIDFVKYGLFANATKSFFNDKLDLSFGFRTDSDGFTEASLLDTFSPRISLSYEFIEDWRVSSTIGRYYKLPPYTILGFRDNSGNLINQDSKYTQSNHYVLGLQYTPTPATIVSLEGFYKQYDDYPVSVLDQVSLANKGADFEVIGSEDVETVGKGRSYGLEFQYQQKLTNNFYAIFSYTYFFSEFTGFDRSEYVPSVWDSRHLISFVGGYKLKKNWEISSRYRFAGKTPFVPTDLNQTLITYPEISLDYSRLGEVKLNTFSQLDARVDKKWNYTKWSLNVFLEVQNILAQDIPLPPEYGLTRDNQGNIITPISLTEIPQDSGIPIPSIGIVVDF